MLLLNQIFRLAFNLETTLQNTCDGKSFIDGTLHRFPDSLEKTPDLFAFTLLHIIA
ncbi:hypothetical protein D3C81_2087200 [compost metagenome]